MNVRGGGPFMSQNPGVNKKIKRGGGGGNEMNSNIPLLLFSHWGHNVTCCLKLLLLCLPHQEGFYLFKLRAKTKWVLP